MTAELDIEVTLGGIRGVPFSNQSADLVLLSGPSRLWGWSIRESAGVVGAGNATGASTAFVAAAAGSASLGVTDALTGFDVTMAAIAAAAGGTVTVSNVVGGPYLFNFEGQVGNAALLSVRFPNPLLASGGAPTVAIGAIVGGGAGNINVYGVQSPGNPARLSIDDGGQSIAEVVLQAGTSMSEWYGPMGMHVSGELLLNMLSGNVTGVLYASFDR